MGNISMVPTPNVTWRTQPQGERLFVTTTCNYLVTKFRKIQLNQQETTFFHGCKVVAVLYAEIFRLGQTQSGEQTNWHTHLHCTL